MTVRRTVEVAMDISGGLLDIIQIVLRPVLKALDMVKGVITYPVSAVEHHLIDIRMLADVISYTEEGSLHTIFIEYIQDPRGNLGNRAVVEGEIYTLLLGRYPPDYPWKQDPVKARVVVL